MLEIRLANFSGPIDLLLHLIRVNELDLFDLDLHLITEQYLHILEREDLSSLSDAYHFLLMASTLVEIKSRMLLPAEAAAGEEGESEAEDMRQDLVRRLSTYQHLKEVVSDLGEKLEESQRKLAPHVSSRLDKSLVHSMKDLSLYDLISSFEEVLARAREAPQIVLAGEEIPLSKAIDEVWRLIVDSEGVMLSELFRVHPGISWIVVSFLAVLELISVGRATFERRGKDFVFTAITTDTPRQED